MSNSNQKNLKHQQNMHIWEDLVPFYLLNIPLGIGHHESLCTFCFFWYISLSYGLRIINTILQ